MKELTIEQKAEAYDEAIERVVNIRTGKCETTFIFTEGLFNYLFPELEECNGEEVREAMIDFFKHEREEGVVVSHYGVNIERMIAWLEKQGEPTDINPSEFDLHLNKLLKQFETLPKEELASSLSFYLNVVQNDGTYREEKQGEQKPQRMISAEAKEAMYGKPAWSEEDDAIRNDLINYFRGSALETPEKEVINFLKSLKDRVQSQPKQEENKGNLGGISSNWSEEDERIVRTIISDGSRGVEFDMLQINWLKSLKQRINL